MSRFIRALEIGDRSFGWVVFLAFLVFLVHKPVLQKFDDLTSPQPWFSVSFSVPDFQQGGEPVVEYTRVINQPVRGFWSVKINPVDDPDPATGPYICTGGDYANYWPHLSGTIHMRLWNFAGTSCDLRPDTYQACAHYELRNDRDNRRRFGPFCDEFTVLKKTG